MHIAILPLLVVFLAEGSIPQLPEKVAAVLNSAYPAWRFIQEGSEYDGARAIRDTHAVVYECELNNDDHPDFALAFTAIKDSVEKDFYSAIVSDGNDYLLFILEDLRHARTIDERVGIRVQKKGHQVSDFDSDNDGTLRQLTSDAIALIPFSGCCETTHIFDSKMKSFSFFTSGD